MPRARDRKETKEARATPPHLCLPPDIRAVDPDPHLISGSDPDPGGKFFQIKTEKMQGN